jgi:hypothetical protein
MVFHTCMFQLRSKELSHRVALHRDMTLTVFSNLVVCRRPASCSNRSVVVPTFISLIFVCLPGRGPWLSVLYVV